VRTVPVILPHAVVAHAGRRRKIVPVSQCFPRPCRDTMLAKLEQARLLVDQCKTASEAKEVIDVAIAAKVYASRQRVSKDIINSATALEIDARTRLGEILERSDRNPGTAGHLIGPGRGNENSGIVVEPPFPQPPTLEELGLTKRESSDAQFLARLKREDGKMHEAVRNNETRLSAARREINTRHIRRDLEDIAAQASTEPVGKFDVIVIDPPWQMERIALDCNPNETRLLPYPTMTLEQIEQLDHVEKYAAKDCHVFLWTTNRYLKFAFPILEKWGVEHSCTFVWHKNRGPKPIGGPQSNCEFCLYGRVGSPVFVDTKQFATCFEADAKKHSEKPEAFYEMLRRVAAGRRLDCFNRRKIEGFVGLGNEAP
jgi:N6-adenosine-specific RNA methylase IME4